MPLKKEKKPLKTKPDIRILNTNEEKDKFKVNGKLQEIIKENQRLSKLCGDHLWGKRVGLGGCGFSGESLVRRRYREGDQILWKDEVELPLSQRLTSNDELFLDFS